MLTEEITIRVDARTAAAYRSADEQKRMKTNLLLRFWLEQPPRSKEGLLELMRETSQEAIRRGLTPEILAEILNEE